MAGFNSVFEVLVSSVVEIGGKGMVHGGRGMLLAGARRIGWANGGGGGQRGRRFGGHRLAGKSLSSGGTLRRSPGGASYNPINDYQQRTLNPYRQAMHSGSGAGYSGQASARGPGHLFGRPGFSAPQSPLGRNAGHSFVRHGNQSRRRSASKNPRAHINFGK